MKPILFLLSVLPIFGGIPGALFEIETYNWNLFSHSYKIVAVPEVIMIPQNKGKEFKTTKNYVLSMNFIYAVNENIESSLGEVSYTNRGYAPKNFPPLEVGGSPKSLIPPSSPAEQADFCGVSYEKKSYFFDCKHYSIFQALKETKQKMLFVFRNNKILGVDLVGP